MQCSIITDYDYLVQPHTHIGSCNYYSYRNFALSHIIFRPFCIKPKDTLIILILLKPSILSFAMLSIYLPLKRNIRAKLHAPSFPFFFLLFTTIAIWMKQVICTCTKDDTLLRRDCYLIHAHCQWKSSASRFIFRGNTCMTGTVEQNGGIYSS